MCLITTQFILASKIYIRTQLSSSVAVFVVLSKAEVVSLQVLNIFHALSLSLSLSLSLCVRVCMCVSVCVVIVCHYVLHCVFSHLVTSLREMRKLIALLILSLAVYRASKFYFVFLACSVCYHCLIFIVTITGPLLVFCALVLVFLTSKTKKVCFEKNRILLCPLAW